jgi:rod shape-determining protein MreD
MTEPGFGLVVVRTSFVLALCLAFQIGIAPSFQLFGVQGDIMLLAAISAGIAAGPDRGAVIGFLSGLLYDSVLTTPFGLSALTYALVAYAVGSLQDSVLRAAWWIPVASAAAASAIGVILYGVLGTVLGEQLVGSSLIRIALVVALLNAIAAPVVIRAMRWATDSEDSVRHRAVYR